MNEPEAGGTLIEAIVCVGIIALLIGALLDAATVAIHRFGGDPYQAALERASTQELRIAADLLKYDDASLLPHTIATSIPLPSSSPLPVTMHIATRALSDGSLAVDLQTASAYPARSVITSIVLAHRAPTPGSSIVAPASAPAPTGAP